MIFLTRDGDLFGGATAEEAVESLRRLLGQVNQQMGETCGAEWMDNLAHRVRLQTGFGVRTSTPELFLNDLTAAGIIIEPVRH